MDNRQNEGETGETVHTRTRTRTPMSACAAPAIMFGTNDLWPGASKIVNRLFSVANTARPTSTVLPFARSSSFVSIMKARYHDSRLRPLGLAFKLFNRALVHVAGEVQEAACEGGLPRVCRRTNTHP